ncbi:NAD(P)-dependent dehydrogenase (short-subunit alcohol dehydrogenase family) [Variovorax boronicumulans]|uniref:SDR family NAD(P)-dependent oxidoreductase n=1 Tax=Variovorax boronicumulans TaxID=436515 RepID=UPI00277FBD39|nr:SDR family oxidoreductase [Variovorax boronicumulans]MDP9995202.1 NAD(P)-dependent dehydrogenase (short-subunit alcohol dehydrogenase family) [Variovorax boronicumulans]MDQ0006492.1 NAD(P)-dependent dehydrogenase (short-subunit alcohol dehydrogenase family) [Variovorax boronicumulans]
MDLNNKRIIVTGAASGIGRAIAVALASRGAAVVATDVRAPHDTLAAIEAVGGRGIALAADVTDPVQTDAMAAQCVERLGGIEGLVNNAGIYSTIVPRPFEQIDLDEWRKLFEVNVFGLARCCQAVVPHMRAAGGGRIVNIISGVPFKGIPFMLHYVASKGAVLGMTRSLAKELGPANILVNGVAPGFTLSDGVMHNPVQLEKLREISRNARSLARDQVADDVVGAVGFFMSAGADFITGQTLLVDGGSHFN